MNRSMWMALASGAMAVCASGAVAQDGVISGTGSAPVTRDADATRARAEEAAKLDLARTMVRQALGAERLGEVPPDMLRRLAGQIRPEMITDRSSERAGNEFRVTLSARIDRAWFQGLLDDEGIRSSSANAGGQTARILVMMDEAVQPARDSSQPSEVVTVYDRDTRSRFSDTSSSAFRERERSASASASAMRAGSASVDGMGGAERSGVAAASRSRSASARETVAVDRTNVQSAESDRVRFRQRVTYQTTATSRAGQAALASLTSGMIQHGVSTSNATNALAQFAPGPTPLFAQLRDSGRLTPFMAHAYRAAQAPFFMGGQFTVVDAGRSEQTGQATCTGEMSAQAFATSNSEDVGSASVSGEMAAATYELCSSQLSESLARRASDTLGPQIQRYWRSQTRGQATQVAAVSGPADWTLTVRAANLDMGMQADLLDAIAATPGVQSHAFLGQSANQISVQVRYDSQTPLHLALYQRLRANPAFAGVRAETSGQSVTLCISAC